MAYETPRTEGERNARDFIEDEGITRTVLDLLNEEFELRYELTLSFGGYDGPGFDEAAGEIQMPYGFVFDIADRFNGNSDTSADIYEVTRDAYLHGLLHQVSHALFSMYDLRTSGDTEKAVDVLAIILILRYYQNGGDVVMNAARLFINETRASPDTTSGRDFWDEHEMDGQSYNQAICLVYGSDPQRHSGLRGESEFLQIRGEECIREYRRQTNAWFRVLGDFLKRPPPE